jgi:hypothetical protein
MSLGYIHEAHPKTTINRTVLAEDLLECEQKPANRTLTGEAPVVARMIALLRSYDVDHIVVCADDAAWAAYNGFRISNPYGATLYEHELHWDFVQWLLLGICCLRASAVCYMKPCVSTGTRTRTAMALLALALQSMPCAVYSRNKNEIHPNIFDISVILDCRLHRVTA